MIVEVPAHFEVKQIKAPASKSYAQRAILAAALTEGKSEIINFGTSNDVEHIIQIAKQLGAEISRDGQRLSIKGHVYPLSNELNCGESGLGVRLTTAIAAALGGTFEITGEGSLLSRPMTQFEEILPKLGVEVISNEGQLPLKISGQLKGGNFEVDGSLSSQFLSGLLMALPLAEEDSWIQVNNLNSLPYIDMTVDVLNRFGIMIGVQENVYFVKGQQAYRADDFDVEGDWSGAAFWVVYGCISNGIIIENINMFSSQADAAIVEILDLCGGKYEWTDEGDLQVFSSEVQPFEADLTHCPDLFPPTVILAAAAQGKTILKGAHRLKHKESDRASVLQKEMSKLGLKIEIQEDEMIIHGQGYLSDGTIDSHNDHRIAMAGAIAAILTKNGVKIEDASAVSKSYPEFWSQIPQSERSS